jgi:hypothetical protein
VLPTRTAGTSLQCRRVNFISSILRSTSTTPRLMLSAPFLKLCSVLNVALAFMPTGHLRARNREKLPQPLIYGSSILQFLHNVGLLFA